jgi:hypothetical protein
MSKDQLRQSQVIAPNGVGAIFDVSGQSFVVESTETWFTERSNSVEVLSPRLSSALRTRSFYAPPADDPDRFGGSSSQRLPVVRFPAWLFCSACRRMVQWSWVMEQRESGVFCAHCIAGSRKRLQLVPMRWVQICDGGHLGDVDWVWFAHSAAPSECRMRDGMRFRTSGGLGAGLSSVEVRCEYCGAGRSLAEISDPQLATRLGMKCIGRHPWQRWEKDSPSSCAREARVVQRRASNVYYPDVHSAIEVPFLKPTISEPDRPLLENPFFTAIKESLAHGEHAQAQMAAQMLAGMFARSTQEVLDLAGAQNAQEAVGTDATPGAPESLAEIAESEWSAFTSAEPFDHDDFRTRITSLVSTANGPVTTALAALVPRVTLADALREVRVFSGFKRVTPESDYVRADGRGFHESPRPSWLPAIEVRGEGVFLSLDEVALEAWESDTRVVARIAGLAEKAARSFMQSRFERHTGPAVSARYVMLHTLAHLLIRRLSFESGYGASSLRERIFARTTTNSTTPMFGGLLIYTAAGDAEGTLGGLVRQGEPRRLAPALLGALDDAGWCSADPLCSEQHAVSLDGLNLASCHACTLISETSCENGNFLLDRALVVGSDTVPGFFAPVLAAVGQARQ